MTTYVMRNGVLVNKDHIPPEEGKRAGFPTPMLISGMEPYTSPIDGRVIRNAHERREDLKRNDCVPWEPGMNQDARKKSKYGGRQRGWSRKHNRPIRPIHSGNQE